MLNFFALFLLGYLPTAVNGVYCLTVGPGMHPDPNDCGSFSTCVHGMESKHRCPSPLHFDPELKVCNWPDDVRCTTKGQLLTASEFCQGKQDGNYANPSGSCTTYVACSGGIQHVMDCPASSRGKGKLHFSPELGECTYPKYTNCHQTS